MMLIMVKKNEKCFNFELCYDNLITNKKLKQHRDLLFHSLCYSNEINFHSHSHFHSYIIIIIIFYSLIFSFQSRVVSHFLTAYFDLISVCVCVVSVGTYLIFSWSPITIISPLQLKFWSYYYRKFVQWKLSHFQDTRIFPLFDNQIKWQRKVS